MPVFALLLLIIANKPVLICCSPEPLCSSLSLISDIQICSFAQPIKSILLLIRPIPCFCKPQPISSLANLRLGCLCSTIDSLCYLSMHLRTHTLLPCCTSFHSRSIALRAKQISAIANQAKSPLLLIRSMYCRPVARPYRSHHRSCCSPLRLSLPLRFNVLLGFSMA